MLEIDNFLENRSFSDTLRILLLIYILKYLLTNQERDQERERERGEREERYRLMYENILRFIYLLENITTSNLQNFISDLTTDISNLSFDHSTLPIQENNNKYNYNTSVSADVIFNVNVDMISNFIAANDQNRYAIIAAINAADNVVNKGYAAAITANPAAAAAAAAAITANPDYLIAIANSEIGYTLLVNAIAAAISVPSTDVNPQELARFGDGFSPIEEADALPYVVSDAVVRAIADDVSPHVVPDAFVRAIAAYEPANAADITAAITAYPVAAITANSLLAARVIVSNRFYLNAVITIQSVSTAITAAFTAAFTANPGAIIAFTNSANINNPFNRTAITSYFNDIAAANPNAIPAIVYAIAAAIAVNIDAITAAITAAVSPHEQAMFQAMRENAMRENPNPALAIASYITTKPIYLNAISAIPNISTAITRALESVNPVRAAVAAGDAAAAAFIIANNPIYLKAVTSIPGLYDARRLFSNIIDQTNYKINQTSDAYNRQQEQAIAVAITAAINVVEHANLITNNNLNVELVNAIVNSPTIAAANPTMADTINIIITIIVATNPEVQVIAKAAIVRAAIYDAAAADAFASASALLAAAPLAASAPLDAAPLDAAPLAASAADDDADDDDDDDDDAPLAFAASAPDAPDDAAAAAAAASAPLAVVAIDAVISYMCAGLGSNYDEMFMGAYAGGRIAVQSYNAESITESIRDPVYNAIRRVAPDIAAAAAAADIAARAVDIAARAAYNLAVPGNLISVKNALDALDGDAADHAITSAITNPNVYKIPEVRAAVISAIDPLYIIRVFKNIIRKAIGNESFLRLLATDPAVRAATPPQNDVTYLSIAYISDTFLPTEINRIITPDILIPNSGFNPDGSSKIEDINCLTKYDEILRAYDDILRANGRQVVYGGQSNFLIRYNAMLSVYGIEVVDDDVDVAAVVERDNNDYNVTQSNKDKKMSIDAIRHFTGLVIENTKNYFIVGDVGVGRYVYSPEIYIFTDFTSFLFFEVPDMDIATLYGMINDYNKIQLKNLYMDKIIRLYHQVISEEDLLYYATQMIEEIDRLDTINQQTPIAAIAEYCRQMKKRILLIANIDFNNKTSPKTSPTKRKQDDDGDDKILKRGTPRSITEGPVSPPGSPGRTWGGNKKTIKQKNRKQKTIKQKNRKQKTIKQKNRKQKNRKQKTIKQKNRKQKTIKQRHFKIRSHKS
jgi:hypothetical protein